MVYRFYGIKRQPGQSFSGTCSSDGQRFSGNAQWTYSETGYSCSGTTQITGTKTSGTQTEATGAWNRTYDSYEYGIADTFMLSYDNGYKAMLDQTINTITRLLEERPTEPLSDRFFTIPANFLRIEGYTDLGPALIIWLKLVIEQQTKKRRIKQADTVLAELLSTTRKTILVYERQLQELGYLNIDTSIRPQGLSVRYFPKS